MSDFDIEEESTYSGVEYTPKKVRIGRDSPIHFRSPSKMPAKKKYTKSKRKAATRRTTTYVAKRARAAPRRKRARTSVSSAHSYPIQLTTAATGATKVTLPKPGYMKVFLAAGVGTKFVKDDGPEGDNNKLYGKAPWTVIRFNGDSYGEYLVATAHAAARKARDVPMAAL